MFDRGWKLLAIRLFGHFRQVLVEYVYGMLRQGMGPGVSTKFLVMRLLTPFGFGRGWDRPAGRSRGTVIDKLLDQGMAELEPLPPFQVASLRSHFCARMGEVHGKSFAKLEDYFDQARADRSQRPPGVWATGHPDCPITQVLCQERFVELATQFLGIDPSRLVVAANMDALIRLDQPKITVSGYDDALELHRDLDSYRFVKIFAYLTDCSINGGHHQIYLKSHRFTPFELGPISRYGHAEVEKAIPEARLHNVEGEAGFVFAENTYAFHRGTKPLTGDRLILNLLFMEDSFMSYHDKAFRVPVAASKAVAAA